MDDQKEEIENLRKQIKSLKIGLMLTQISTIVFTIIFGCQCLRSIRDYHCEPVRYVVSWTERRFWCRKGRQERTIRRCIRGVDLPQSVTSMIRRCPG